MKFFRVVDEIYSPMKAQTIGTIKTPALPLRFDGDEILARVEKYQRGGPLHGLAGRVGAWSPVLQDLVAPTGLAHKDLKIELKNGVVTKTDPHTRLVKEDHIFNLPGLRLPGGEEIDSFTMFVARVYHRFKLDSKRLPVVLCHGAFTNGNSWQVGTEGRNVRHLHKYDSFANFLASKGFDVYMLNLPYAKRIYSRYVQSVYGVPYRPDPDIGFDELQEYVPSVIDFALATHNETMRAENDKEKGKINWIGHSLGGMLMYAYLSRQDERINAVAALGSPISLNAQILRWASNFNRLIERLGKEERRTQEAAAQKEALGAGLSPGKRLALAIVPLTDGLYFTPSLAISTVARFAPLIDYIYNPENADPYMIKPFILSAAEPIYARLFDFFLHMARRNEFVSATPGLDCDYIELMGQIETPLFLGAGEKDWLATVGSIKNARRFIANRLPAHERDHRFPMQVFKNTGHADLISGHNALTEVARSVIAFFDRHA